jgi:hypothetical protein
LYQQLVTKRTAHLGIHLVAAWKAKKFSNEHLINWKVVRFLVNTVAKQFVMRLKQQRKLLKCKCRHLEPELATAVGEGRCKEFAAFGWKPKEVAPPQSRETFERSKLNWNELAKNSHAKILEWHRKLIALRRAEKDLSDGDLKNVRVEFDEKKALARDATRNDQRGLQFCQSFATDSVASRRI